MLIALASGKGGVGKTTVSVNLALSFAQKGVSTQLLDCDVEEPDCHLYLKPTISSHEPVTVLVPSVDESRCNYCGQCSRLCAYGAIICLPNKIDVFPELCHSCGGCALVCEQAAITEKPREIGTIEEGHCDELAFAHGFLKIGEIRAVSVIADLIQRGRKNNKEITIIDAPPGTSCPVVEAVKDCDFLCLVTEPTRFGLHDLEMAVDVGRVLVHAIASGKGPELSLVASHQDRVGYDGLVGAKLHAALPADGQDGTLQVLVRAHATRHAVHDDADVVRLHAKLRSGVIQVRL